MIANRYICRDWQSGNENHITIERSGIPTTSAAGFFRLDWQANGLRYGIGKDNRPSGLEKDKRHRQMDQREIPTRRRWRF